MPVAKSFSNAVTESVATKDTLHGYDAVRTQSGNSYDLSIYWKLHIDLSTLVLRALVVCVGLGGLSRDPRPKATSLFEMVERNVMNVD